MLIGSGFEETHIVQDVFVFPNTALEGISV